MVGILIIISTMRLSSYGLLLLIGVALQAQQRPAGAIAPLRAGKAVPHPVDTKNRYHRVICVVPLIGSGTRKDPKRPLYVPAPTGQGATMGGIIAFQQIPTDDKKFVIVEYVAADMKALDPILNDKSLKVFEKGKHSRQVIEQELKLVRKDFDLSLFGITVR